MSDSVMSTLTWLSFATSVVFGVLSIYFFLRSRRTRQFGCVYDSRTLQTKAHPDVEITFRGRPIADLSRMVFAIWNVGTEAIRAADVPKGRFPEVYLEDAADVLSVTVLGESENTLGLAVTQVGRARIRFEFDYLNPGDGAVVEVLSARPTDGRRFGFDGPLIGGGAPRVETYEPPPSRIDRIMLTAFPLTMLIGGIGITVLSFVTKESDLPILHLILGLGSIVAGFAGLQANARLWLPHPVPAFARTLMSRA